jgi:hypothetical protein
MLSVLHFWLGLTVVLLNLLAAGWLGRGAVLIQALLGVFLTINGYVGDQFHYLFALIAIVVIFVAFRSPKLNDTVAKQAASCAIVALATAGAFMFGQMAG